MFTSISVNSGFNERNENDSNNWNKFEKTFDDPGWQVLTDEEIITTILQLSQKDYYNSDCARVVFMSTHSETLDTLQKALIWLEAQPKDKIS